MKNGAYLGFNPALFSFAVGDLTNYTITANTRARYFSSVSRGMIAMASD
jgi:hypothetical protein